MRDIDLKVERVPLDALREYEGNAKEHPAEQVEQIAESMREFGNCDPIAVWTNGAGELEIVEGHGRLLALRKLGATEAPVIYLDHLSDEQRRAYTHVHNQTTLNSGFDVDVLQQEIDSLPDFDWDAFGFGDIEGLNTSEAPEVIEFHDVDEPTNAPTRAQVGDIWLLGEHRLAVGDSTDPEVIAKAMDGRKADLLLTDPPYNVALGHHMRPSEAKQLHRRTDGLVIDNDSWQSDEDFQEFLVKAFRNSLDNMRAGAAFYIWYASTQSGNFFAGAKDAGLEIRQVIVWNKSVFALGRQDYQWKHEPCLYGWKDGAAHYFTDDRTLSTVWDGEPFEPRKATKEQLAEFAEKVLAAFDADVWDFKKPSRSEQHPTMKPVPLMGKSIANSTRRGETVLDPFGGSGSTLLACEQSGRKCVTVELDPHYADVIIKRWEDETGRKAVKA